MSNNHSVEIEPPAWDAVMNLPTRDQERVIKTLESLEENPRPSGVKKLQGGGNLYRVRSGDFRIIYSIEDARLVVLVVKIGNRREVYR
jgi:mRNA interferase RelE/StbE